MFPIPFHSCALRDLVKSPCPPVKLRANPGLVPPFRSTNDGLFVLLPLGVK